jgi:hypothetical protein
VRSLGAEIFNRQHHGTLCATLRDDLGAFCASVFNQLAQPSLCFLFLPAPLLPPLMLIRLWVI